MRRLSLPVRVVLAFAILASLATYANADVRLPDGDSANGGWASVNGSAPARLEPLTPQTAAKSATALSALLPTRLEVAPVRAAGLSRHDLEPLLHGRSVSSTIRDRSPPSLSIG